MKKLIVIIFLLLAMPVNAYWNNENIKTDQHPKITEFSVTETGYIANTADDTQIIYIWVYPELLRGEWEDAYFFVCKGKFIYGDNLKEFSICLNSLN